MILVETKEVFFGQKKASMFIMAWACDISQAKQGSYAKEHSTGQRPLKMS